MTILSLQRLLMAAAFTVAAITVSPATAPAADQPPDFVPLGVYLSWERPTACAKALGTDRWTDVCRRLNALKANSVNLLWVTNMVERDLPRLIRECKQRRIRLLPCMSSVEAKIDWRWAPGSTYYDKALPKLLAAAGTDPTLIGWVLSDEPKSRHLPRLENLRKRFKKLDPDRFCTAVTMLKQTPEVPIKTKLPVICFDLYPFFGPNNPNGPHTDAASRSYYRSNALKMINAIGDRNAVGWVMGMCFSEIWGPRTYDKNWHMLGLPGAYLHWRCPTPAEMRWQVWESLRCGARGFISYTLAPEAPKPGSAGLAPPDVKWRSALVKKPTDSGPNALTNPDASTTPQLKALGRVYARLAPHGQLIRSWKRTTAFVAKAEAPGKAQAFSMGADKALAIVLVNDDLRNAREITIRVGNRVTVVKDILTGVKLALSRASLWGDKTARLKLAAGDGTILSVIETAPTK